MPWDFQDRVPFVPTLNTLKPTSMLKLFITYQNPISVKLYFRNIEPPFQLQKPVQNVLERYKLQYSGPLGDCASVNTLPGIVTIKISKNAKTNIYVPYIYNSDGSDMIIEHKMHSTEILCGQDNKLFINIDRNQNKINEMNCSLKVNVHYPLKWFDMYPTTVDINISKPSLFLLYEYIYQFTSLSAHWSSGDYGALHKFLPYSYTVNLNIRKGTLALYTNPQNVVDIFPYSKDNKTIIIELPEFCCNIFTETKSFMPQLSKIDFNVKIVPCQDMGSKGRPIIGYISHPYFHPLSQLRDGSGDTATASECIEISSLQLSGYKYYSSFYDKVSISLIIGFGCN